MAGSGEKLVLSYFQSMQLDFSMPPSVAEYHGGRGICYWVAKVMEAE
jgi:hypothetical protein